MNDFLTLRKRTEEAFDGLSPRLRQAARYLLDHPEEVAFNSMRTLAAHAQVPPATLVRLARSLGYGGYQELREPFRQRLSGRAAGFTARARELQAQRREDETEILLRDIVAADTVNLQQSFTDVGADRLAACADMLAEARRIYVVGVRSCYPIAFYFQYAWNMFHDDAVLLASGGGTFADALRRIGGEDVLLAISFHPYSRETVQAVEFASARDARVIAVTDSSLSPLARGASEALVVANKSPSFFQSLVGALSVSQALIAILVARGGNQGLNSLAASEDHLEHFDAYWRENGPQRARR